MRPQTVPPRRCRAGRARGGGLRPLQLALTLLLASSLPGGGVAAQGRIGWAAEERVLISDFSTIVALAGDGWRIYAATPHGLLAWDAGRRRWGLPLTIEDGFPAPEQPSALAWSHGEQALVLGTRLGRLWRIDPVLGRVEPLATVGGPVEQLVGSRAGELFVRTRGGWLELAPGSMIPRPAAGVPADAIRADQRVRALAGTLGVDERLRRWRVTDFAAGPRPDEFYAGTAGGGLLQVDARTLAVDQLRYGGTGRVVTALARLGGSTWFAGGPPARGRASVFAADTSLQQWDWPEPLAGAPTTEVPVLLGVSGVLWAGAGDGLYRLAGGERWERFSTRERLPSNLITALANRDSVIWVGTRQGACTWQGDACGPTLLPGHAITALSYCQGALWLGTGRGLWRANGAELGPADPPGFTGRVQALACAEGTLYLAEPQRLVPHAAGGWEPPLGVPGIGTLLASAAAGTDVWVGGSAGAARWDAAARAWTTYLVPNDIPAGPVHGVLPGTDHVWLATPAGALRFELRGR